jgi:hypothetical protein
MLDPAFGRVKGLFVQPVASARLKTHLAEKQPCPRKREQHRHDENRHSQSEASIIDIHWFHNLLLSNYGCLVQETSNYGARQTNAKKEP